MWHSKKYPGYESTTGVLYRYGSVQSGVGLPGRYSNVSPFYNLEHAVCDPDGPASAYQYLNLLDRGISEYGFSDPKVATALHAKLVNQVQSEGSAELLTSLVEYGSSYNMIARRAVTLRRAFNALRRFDLPSVAKELALPKDTQRNVERRVSKKHLVTQNWLEYWMGWAPLIGDIESSIKVLSSTPRYKPLRVSISREKPVKTGSVGSNGPFFPWFNHYTDGILSSRYSWYGHITVNNPTTVLASQLGLLNPVATAWAVVPFSFIVDWFVNVDQLLSSSSPFYGYSITHTCGGLKSTISSSRSHTVLEVVNGYWVPRTIKQNFKATGYFRRKMPIPTPSLVVDLPDRLSLSRAATSVSLLTQLFLKP